MKTIKIAYIVSTLGQTGPNKQLFNLVKNLDQEIFSAEIITLSHEPRLSLWEDFHELNIRLHTLSLSRMRGLFFAYPRLLHLLHRIRPDIIHTQGFRPDYLAKNFRERPLFSTQRNNPFSDYPMLYGSALGYLLALTHIRVLRKIPNLVVCSDIIKDGNQKYSIPSMCIRNGVDLSLGQTISSPIEKTRVRRELGQPVSANIIVFAGPLIQRKAPDLLIQFFSDLSFGTNTYLYILGEGPLMSRCRDLSRNKTNIVVQGHVKDVDRYLMAADGFISLSTAEGLPNSVLEALAWGLPVVLSDIPAHREILQFQPRAGLLVRYPPLATTRREINELLIDANSPHFSRSIVLEHLNAKTMSEQYQEQYIRVVNYDSYQ